MKRLSILLALLCLVACKPAAASTPESRLMLVVMGSRDVQADTRERMPDRLRRRATWRTQLPLPAREVQVTYDQEQRPLAWRVDLTGSQDSPQALAGGTLRPLGSWQGLKLSKVTDGPLRGSLLAVQGQNLTLMSAPYAAHYEAEASRLAAGQ